MQRRTLTIIVAALVLLLAVGATTTFLLVNQGGGPRPSVADTTPTSAPPTQVAQAPLKAEPGDTVVTLTWEPIADAAGYFVYREGGKDPLNPAPVTETRYTDIGLTNGRTYTYQVAPADAAGLPGTRSVEVKVAPTSK
jgi:hypothetical protein